MMDWDLLGWGVVCFFLAFIVGSLMSSSLQVIMVSVSYFALYGLLKHIYTGKEVM